MTDPQLVPLFPTAQPDEIEIKFDCAVGAAKYVLTHVFRPPSAEDRKSYQRLLHQTTGKGADFRLVTDHAGASEMLYERCCLRAEGYDCSGRAGWKESIPLRHKQAAVDALLAREGDLTEVERGN